MKSFSTAQEAAQAWRDVAPALDSVGIHFPEAKSFIAEPLRTRFDLAMDAQPGLITTSNAGIPSIFTTFVDPAVIDVLQAPVQAAKIAGEVRKGSWTDDTVTFIVVENTGYVSSYADYTGNGRSGANTNFVPRQPYLFQTVEEYGELEMERAGLARLNWAGQIQKSSANNLMRFANRSYFLGIAGLQNYGLLNDPYLAASLTASPKAAGGTAWAINSAPNASANEVYNDVVALAQQVITNSAGHVDAESELVLAIPTQLATALTYTNSFGKTVAEMLKNSYPKLRVETAVQYGAQTAQNPEGNLAGNIIQLFAPKMDGDDTVYCAFNEKMRAHAVIRDLSSFKQKKTSGTVGAIWRRPVGAATMLGV